jgi:hypothetical protein
MLSKLSITPTSALLTNKGLQLPPTPDVAGIEEKDEEVEEIVGLILTLINKSSSILPV